MNFRSKYLVRLASLSALATIALSAPAYSLEVTATLGSSLGGTIDPSDKTSSLSTTVFGSSTGRTAGEYSLTNVIVNPNGESDPSLPVPLTELPGALDFSSYAWCIDPSQTISIPGTHTWDLVVLEDAPSGGLASDMMDEQADDLRRLFGEQYPELPIDGTSELNGSDFINAFQLAIWEIVTDSDYNLGAGDFQYNVTSGDVFNMANTWLVALAGSGADDWDMANNLFALTNDSKQDFIVAIQTPGGATPVPLPAAVWLFGSAMLGVAGIGYRRNRKRDQT